MTYEGFLKLLYELQRSNWYAIPTKNMRKGVFLQHSLKRWAISEIILYAEDKGHYGLPPSYVMESFCKMVDDFACLDKPKDLNEDITYTFSVAYDVGMSVLDMLLV